MPFETPEEPAAEHPPPEPTNNKPRNQVLLLGLLIMVVGLVGALAWEFGLQNKNLPGTEHNAVVGITIFIQAMIAFFGILNLEEPHRTKVSPLTKGGMRAAITGAIVVTYLSLVIFHTMMDFTVVSSGPRDSSEVRDTFVSSFTWVVNLTIFFYFASEAGIHWMNQSKPTGVSHYLSSPKSAKGTESGSV